MTRQRSSRLNLVVLLVITPLLGFLILAIWLVSATYEQSQRADRNLVVVELDGAIHQAVRDLQVERGRSQILLGLAVANDTSLDQYALARANSEASVTRLAETLANNEDEVSNQANVATRKALAEIANRESEAEITSRSTSASDAFETQTTAINKLLAASTTLLTETADGDAETMLAATLDLNLQTATEAAGQERGMLSRVFANDQPMTDVEQPLIESSQFQQTDNLATVDQLLSGISLDLSAQRDEIAKLSIPVDTMRDLAAKRAEQGNYDVDPGAWFVAATNRMDAISEVSNQIDNWAIDRINSGAREAQQRFWLVLLISVVVLAFAGVLSRLVLSQSHRQSRAEAAARLEATIADNMAEGVLIARRNDAKIAYANPRLEDMFGYDPGEMIDMDSRQILFKPNDELRHMLARDIPGPSSREHWRGEIPTLRKDGSRMWCLVSVASFDHGDFGPVTVSVCSDVSQEKENEQKLAAEEAQHRAVLDTSHDGIIVIDLDGIVRVANPAVSEIFGFTHDEIVGHNVSVLMPEPDKSHHDGYLTRYRSDEGVDLMNSRRDLIGQRKDGSVFPLELSLSEIRTPGQPLTIVGNVRDITDRKLNEDRLIELAEIDQLTGLMNQRHFREAMKESITLSTGTDRHWALLFIDLDNFKQVNDSYGHQVGDSVLIKVAGLLKQAVRQDDAVARIGGDEFAVILYGLEGSDDATATRTAQRILTSVAGIVEVEGVPIDIGASVGIAFFPTDGTNPDELLRHSDAAMYLMKAANVDRLSNSQEGV